VEIIEGPYAGSTARIYKGSKDSLKVFVEIQGLNVVVYAEVPYKFIVPVVGKKK
jgi:transcription antitermination factor NusG